MSDTKPIPVRLDDETIARLDRAAARLGNTRAGVIKLCLTAFLDHFESAGGVATLPLNWREIVQYWDRRTRRSRGEQPKPTPFVTGKETAYVMNEADGPAAPPIPTKGGDGEAGENASTAARAKRRRKGRGGRTSGENLA